jgi:hypothetical protein
MPGLNIKILILGYQIGHLIFLVLYGLWICSIQRRSGAHPASYPTGNGSAFPGDEVPGA